MNPDAIVELLAALIGDRPDLSDCACRDHWRVFDASANDERARATALAICTQCPALARCQAWYGSLPNSHKPVGVCAGVFKPKRVKRQAEAKAQTGHKPAQIKPRGAKARRAAQRAATEVARAQRRKDRDQAS
jgi:hypothetical protein